MNPNDIYEPTITHIGLDDMEMCFDTFQTNFMLKEVLKTRLKAALGPRLDPQGRSSEQIDAILQEFLDDLAMDMQDTEIHIQMKMR